MPVAAVTKCRKNTHSRKVPKLPEGAPEKLERCEASAEKEAIDDKLSRFVDDLMTSEWQPYCARPSRDIQGFYVIFRWFNKEKSWVPLYVDGGKIHTRLDQHFSGREHAAIGKYLSSFPKDARQIIWIKWAKDPFYPYEGLNLSDVIRAVSTRYNDGQMPAFNSDDDTEAPLPDNFSIVPDWQPAKSKLGKKRQSPKKR